MDSVDDNAVVNEPEVRRTRSGRAVRPPPAKQTARKTRKKMVLVEVEVSEEEDEGHEKDANESTNSEHMNKTVDDSEIFQFAQESTGDGICIQVEQESVAMDQETSVATNDGGSEQQMGEDSCNEFSNTFQGDSSTDQNDSRSVQFGSEQPFPEQNSNQDDVMAGEQDNNQDSMQTEENSSVNEPINEEESKDDESREHFDVSELLNTDSQTQCKPDSDKDEGNDNITAEPMETYDVESKETEERNTEFDADNVTEQNIDDSKDTNDEKSNKETDEMKEDTSEETSKKQSMDPDTEVISEDELPTVQAAKVPETEEVSDEELPGPKLAELPADTEVVSEDELPSVKKEGSKRPKLAELPADTEVVSEDELPSVKKEGTKRKLEENEYDPGSPTSESEQSAAKKPALDSNTEVKKDDKQSAKARKLPELDKYWKAVNDDPTDFTGWTYLLQYVDQENDMEAAREAYDAFLSHYPYCYGYWRKYADYEKRKGNKKKCEEVFERGLKAIPLSVDLWLHYLNYTRSTHAEDEDHIRAQYERALTSCGLEFRSDRLWDGYIKWETEGKRLQHVTSLYDRLLATPTQGYTNHFDNFQEHVATYPPNKIIEVDEFLALRKEIKHLLKHDTSNDAATNSDTPPGEGDGQDSLKSDEETTALKERIVSIRRKIHKNTVNAVTARWNFEEGIKRPYFHVKPLERCQLKNWKEYLDFEIEQGDRERIIVLFERCLIACALYEEFWLRFVHYLEGLNDPEVKPKIRDVYERACTIHHLNKPSLHLQWAMSEECCENFTRAAEILINLEKSVPNLLQVAYRRINLERRRGDYEKCAQLYEHYINNSKNKMISSNLAIKYARFCLKICKSVEKSFEVLNKAIEKDNTNPRLYLQLIDLTLQKDGVSENEVLDYIDQFLNKEAAEVDQKVLFAQRKLEFLEDFGSDIQSVQKAYDDYQKYCKLNKEKKKKDESKSSDASGKKAKDPPLPPTQSSSYSNYGGYGATPATCTGSTTGTSYSQYNTTAAQGQYGNQYGQYPQNDQYQYQNWQYSQSGYGNYNQWGSYGNYY